jgi:hypothetical protein
VCVCVELALGATDAAVGGAEVWVAVVSAEVGEGGTVEVGAPTVAVGNTAVGVRVGDGSGAASRRISIERPPEARSLILVWVVWVSVSPFWNALTEKYQALTAIRRRPAHRDGSHCVSFRSWMSKAFLWG